MEKNSTFGCWNHEMKILDTDSIMFMMIDDKYKPAKEIKYCMLCKSSIRTLK